MKRKFAFLPTTCYDGWYFGKANYVTVWLDWYYKDRQDRTYTERHWMSGN